MHCIHRFIGALYGRMVGRLLVDLHGGVPTDIFWQWIDPGALALIGSASFFGGVSRLTMSLAVIMVHPRLKMYSRPILILKLQCPWRHSFQITKSISDACMDNESLHENCSLKIMHCSGFLWASHANVIAHDIEINIFMKYFNRYDIFVDNDISKYFHDINQLVIW